MKLTITILSLFLAFASSSQAAIFSYKCQLPHKPEINVTVDTDDEDEVLLGSIQPIDQSLPEIQFTLAYNYKTLFKPAYGKIALIIKNGRTSTVIYTNPEQTIATTFESGQSMPGNWGGGSPQTSKFHVVCNPDRQIKN